MINLKNYGLVLMAILCSTNNAFAVNIPESMRESMATNTVGMPSLLHLIVSMIVVIAMIYVTGFIYAKLNVLNRTKLNGLSKDDKDKHRFTVLQSLPLGQQRHIYSIEMDGKIFLVGSTPNQISLIKEFEQNSSSAADIENELKKQSIEQSINEEKTSDRIDINELYKKYKN